MPTTRIVLTLLALVGAGLRATEVPLRWLGGDAPPSEVGVTWGVPFARGAVPAAQIFALRDAAGETRPLQTWPLATWPDGTLKWLGVATVAGPESGKALSLVPAEATVPDGASVRVRSSETMHEVDTGRVRARFAIRGANLVESLAVDGRTVARHGRLVGIVQEGPELDSGDLPPRERFGTEVEKVTVEQTGPVRAVVRVEGRHRGARSQRLWLPFTVRFYFYAGRPEIRLVHSFVFDGDQERDFIRGLGLAFAVPFREEVHNRHVRFSGEADGLWAEPVQPMVGRGGRFVGDPAGGGDLYPRQARGERVPNYAEVDDRGRGWLDDWAVWGDFRLLQPNANGFTVEKRTGAHSAWIPAGAGRRASGLAFVGDVSGGLGVSVRNFWQSYPAALEIRGAATGEAELTAWLWSPDAPAMDMRHYSDRAHGLQAAYEDVQPGFSTAHGVARTSELTLFPTASVPADDEAVKLARLGEDPPLLVATPDHLHAAQAFGVWGREDRSTPAKRTIEERLDRTLEFYLTQPEQHQWYGFWDYGDVMHSFDRERNVWRYDLGGMAWANSELGPDLWLWYSFLRSGRKDVFRMAEAMTRHTGEVDCYHLGPFAGLGSRHNVRHWGCGAKEARISQAAYRRFHYYLTADERTGDLMRAVVDVDYKTVEYDPMRLAQPITETERAIAPTRVRLGPDWLAFAGNWMTEWERTGDPRWRDKILAGVESLAAMPLGMRTGVNLVMGYDPESGRLHALDDRAGVYNLATIMGGAEVAMELGLMLDDERWHRLWLQYCRLYSAPKDVVLRDMATGAEGADASYVRDGRLAGYVFRRTGQEAFKQAAIDALFARARGDRFLGSGEPVRVEGPAALNPIDLGPANTNSASQNGLEIISMLGAVGDHLPEEVPPAPPGGGGRRGGR
jgi:hypothetical protein